MFTQRQRLITVVPSLRPFLKLFCWWQQEQTPKNCFYRDVMNKSNFFFKGLLFSAKDFKKGGNGLRFMPIEVDCRYVVSCRRTEAFCGIPFFISKDFPMELKTFALRWLRDKVLRTASLLATRSGVTRQWRTTCSIQHQRDRGRKLQ